MIAAPKVLLLAASLVAAAPERPRDSPVRRLAIVAVDVGNSDKVNAQPALFEAVLGVAELRLGIEAATYAELYTEAADPVARHAADCGSDLACMASLLERAGYALALRAVINRAVEPALVKIEVVDTAAKRVLAEAHADVPSNALLDAARAKTKEALDRAGLKPASRILVTVSPADAEITLADGTGPDPGRTNRFTVAPGRIVVRARRAGFQDGEAAAVATEGGQTAVALRLVEIESNASVLSSPWFWVAGAALLAAGGATAAALALRPGPDCLCVSAHGNCGACSR